MVALQIIWFVLIAVLLIGYAVLDGFDLGVGVWHLFLRGDAERRASLAAIGPLWDGNEVWLLTGGGALFAAFPHVYATVFSGFYLALMLLLFALIFRAVSVEFRGKEESPRWRNGWSIAFALGSIIPALLFGVALGNLMRGLPLDASRNFTGTFLSLLNPYALLIGLTGLAIFAVHGARFLAVKLEGEVAQRARKWASIAGTAFWLLLLISVIATVRTQPLLMQNYNAYLALWLLPLGIAVFGFLSMLSDMKNRYTAAFVYWALTIVMTLASVATALFPRMVPALNDPALSLTVYNASSSQLTLTVMLVLALIGMPLVIGYTVWAYRAFSGKVSLEDAEY
jgi:cytochrome d ubiquinol oxidase subunit II